jgi:hypothetical protein
MKGLVSILVISFSLNLFAQEVPPTSFVLGSRSSYFTELGRSANTLNFVQTSFRDETHLEESTLKTNVEMRAFDPSDTNEGGFVDPLNISVELLMNSISFQTGFLRYRFSETFGLQILDVANPRDYSDFVLNDLSWAKRSVFGMNMQNRLGKLEMLWMVTVWPNGDRLPFKNTPFDLTEGRFGYQGGTITRPWFQDLEYGVRLKYLFESGLDLSFLAYHHFVRPTTLSLVQTAPTMFEIESSNRMVNSLGMAGSYVIGDWVLRGDFLFTAEDSFQKDLINFEMKDHFQQLLGIDRLWNDWSFGAQIQSDFTHKRNFLGLKIENTSFAQWKPSAMIFKGDKNADQWLQVKNSFEISNWNFNITYDVLEGRNTTEGIFGTYRKYDRILTEVMTTF